MLESLSAAGAVGVQRAYGQGKHVKGLADRLSPASPAHLGTRNLTTGVKTPLLSQAGQLECAYHHGMGFDIAPEHLDRYR